MIGLYLWWIGWAIFKKPLTGVEGLLGKQGIARTDLTLANGGEVTIDGIIWKAKLADADSEVRAPGKNVSKGDSVVVVRVSGLTLIVRISNENGR